MDIQQLRSIGRIVYYGICLAALLRGDRPLRWASVVIFANVLLSPALHLDHVGNGPLYGLITIDLALFVALAAMLVRDRRWWLVAATGFSLMSLLTHFAALIGTRPSLFVMDSTRTLWSYAMVFALGWGLLQHERCRRRVGREDVIRALIADTDGMHAKLDGPHLSAGTAADALRRPAESREPHDVG
jgi:hypothetical protein